MAPASKGALLNVHYYYYYYYKWFWNIKLVAPLVDSELNGIFVKHQKAVTKNK